MAINNKTYQPVQAVSIRAVEDLPAFRFVSHLGSLCAQDSKSLGVTEVDWVNGELASIVTLGTIAIETITSVDVGDNLTAANEGKAKSVSSNEPVNGRALESTSGAGFVRMILVQ